MNSLGERFAREGWACGLVVLCGEWQQEVVIKKVWG